MNFKREFQSLWKLHSLIFDVTNLVLLSSSIYLQKNCCFLCSDCVSSVLFAVLLAVFATSFRYSLILLCSHNCSGRCSAFVCSWQMHHPMKFSIPIDKIDHSSDFVSFSARPHSIYDEISNFADHVAALRKVCCLRCCTRLRFVLVLSSRFIAAQESARYGDWRSEVRSLVDRRKSAAAEAKAREREIKEKMERDADELRHVFLQFLAALCCSDLWHHRFPAVQACWMSCRIEKTQTLCCSNFAWRDQWPWDSIGIANSAVCGVTASVLRHCSWHSMMIPFVLSLRSMLCFAHFAAWKSHNNTVSIVTITSLAWSDCWHVCCLL